MENSDQDMDSGYTMARPGIWWWLGQLLLTGIACFFTCFGISLLVASYRLGDPFSFIMTFFAANLMILISLVMVIGIVLRMWRVMQAIRCPDQKHTDP